MEATAYLMPRTRDHDGTVSGWWVRVHIRQQGVGFSVYTGGGARAAVYTGVDAAATTALHIEAMPTRIGHPG